MSRPIRITLNGSLGSGKSTVGRRLADRLGIEFISTGMIFREIGKAANLDALETNLAAEKNTAIDFQVDGYIRELAASDRSFAIDSRMAWHWVPDSLDVFLHVSPATAARRILADRSRDSESYADQAEAEAKIGKRRDSELHRYASLYQVDIESRANYHLFIATDEASIDDIVEVIVSRHDNQTMPGDWLGCRCLVPLSEAPGPATQRPPASGTPLPMHYADGYGYCDEETLAVVAAWPENSSLMPFLPSAAPKLNATSDASEPLRRQVMRARPHEHFLAWSAALGQALKFADEYAEPDD